MTSQQLPGYRLTSFAVESELSRWKRFEGPGFLIEFSYPDPTPNGQAVDRETYRVIFDPRSELNARVIATSTTAA